MSLILSNNNGVVIWLIMNEWFEFILSRFVNLQEI